jgi:hypothetical protein
MACACSTHLQWQNEIGEHRIDGTDTDKRREGLARFRTGVAATKLVIR